MQRFLVVGLVCVSGLVCAASDASAQTIGGDVISVQPAASGELDGGGLGMWAAGTIGSHAYLGGELSIGSYATPEDAGISYHVLGGVRQRVASRFVVLADAGAGVTQQLAMHLGLFGGESGLETVAWMPSAALRVQLVGEIGKIHDTTIGLGLSTETRVGMPLHGDYGMGAGVGLGLYLAR